MNKNEFAPTPPMGWNSFDYYDAAVTEEDIRKNADYMAAHLKEFGYEYIVTDIAWYAENSGKDRVHYEYIPFDTVSMDEYSRLVPDPVRFPSSREGKGFRPLADYVHERGLKFGIHIMRGIPRYAAANHLPIKGSPLTADKIANPFSICLWNSDMYGLRDCEASQAYYDSLLELYASWGVDYIKCDDICDSRIAREGEASTWHEIRMLHNAIQKCGRPIVLSLSPGAALIEKSWVYARYANMWRMTDDFWDNYELLKPMFRRCEMWQDHVRKGCFPDCDMLPVGTIGKNFGEGKLRQTRFTPDEQKMMMTLWCMFRAPLMIGAELTMLDPDTLALLTNRELLTCLAESCRGEQLARTDRFAVWQNTDAATGAVRLGFFNLSEEPISVREMCCGIEDCVPEGHPLEDLWEPAHQISAEELFSESTAVRPHSVLACRAEA